ncbi:MAG: ergothioneine biosynthesis protein EgtB [Acetobacterales bacterium]
MVIVSNVQQKVTPAGIVPARQSLIEQFRVVRGWSERLAEPLSAEDQTIQTMPDVSPTKWHLAHTSWFFEAFILKPHQPDYLPLDPRFHYLFNSYYEALGERHPRPRRGFISRPGRDEVVAFRRHIDEAMAALVADCDDRTFESVAPLVVLGLHHEQQHQELILTDIKHVLSCNPLWPAYKQTPPAATTGAAPLRWHEFEGGLAEIGSDRTGPGMGYDEFGFDNEGPRHKVWLEPFRLASRPVTNGEFLEFIEDGGYRRHELWLSDGWATVNAEGWTAPMYWQRRDDGGFDHLTLGGRAPVDPAAPACHLSFYEAAAYANWAGKRLPSEAEWEVAAEGIEPAGNLLDSGHFRPVAASGTVDGPAQLYGDVWEWTGSAYLGYPGFRAAAGAVGEYNGKFMCNQFVLRGGSCATPPGHIRRSYRNFFPPNARWQFSGLRLADDA